MKKFRIRDDEGNNYEVEEIETVEPVELTQEEIISLKELASKASEILALLNNEVVDEDKEEEVKDKEEKEVVDEDKEEVKDEDEEEIIDSEEKEKVKDSKKSYGSIESHKSIVDSFDKEQEIAKAWAKRYGGK